MNPTPESSTREWLVITVVTVVGAVLRCWAFGGLSLSHFDEGIYAFAGLWSVSRHGLFDLDPSIIAYAPPGFPLLVGLSYGLFGVSDHAALVVGIVAGSATIPVVGWLGRRTFGPGAGASAATFAALAMAHVAFSRKALTDTPFLLAWLVAIGMGGRLLERPGPGRAIALGLAVGIAQNFKYNGWLAGVIVGLAAVAGAVVHPENRGRGPLLRTFGWGVFAAATAALVYAPWYGFVASHGGYAALLRHHRGYLNAAAWLPRWRTQLGEAYALSGPWYGGALTGLLAWLAGTVAAPGALRGKTWRPHRAPGSGLGVVLVVLGGSFPAYFPWWLGVGLAPWLLAGARPAVRVAGVWGVLMAILTPFYYPYARLWLPLHALGWLLMTGLLNLPALELGTSPSKRQRHVLAGVALACTLSAAVHVAVCRPWAIPWSWVLNPPEPSLRQFAFETVPRLIPRKGTTVCVYAVRPLAFYLAQLGRYAIELEPASARLLEGGGPPDSWALIERAMLMKGGYHEGIDYPWTLVTRKYHSASVFVADPVTLLDAHPDAAFSGQPRNVGLIYVWSPLIPALDPRADTALPPTGPAHEP